MIYRPDAPLDVLEQGDVLQRTERLEGLLAQYHPYYASHKENKFFTVLTQSCDMVIRNGKCGARYISLAPVRSLKVILQREFEHKLENVVDGGKPFAGNRVRAALHQFLERLFKNNEPTFFYFEAAQEFRIPYEMCALLGLSISLKPEHYEILTEAKVAGITDVFQAKLGWLVGQMYSRVGTPDMEEPFLTEKVNEYSSSIAIWLDDPQAKALKALVADYRAKNNNATVGLKELEILIPKIPKKKADVIDAVISVVTAKALLDGPQTNMLRRALDQDPKLAQLFR